MLFFLCLYLDVSAVTMATLPSLIMAPHYSHDAKTEGLTSSRGAHQVRDGRELSQHKPVLLRGARGSAKPGDSDAAWQPRCALCHTGRSCSMLGAACGHEASSWRHLHEPSSFRPPAGLCGSPCQAGGVRGIWSGSRAQLGLQLPWVLPKST